MRHRFMLAATMLLALGYVMGSVAPAAAASEPESFGIQATCYGGAIWNYASVSPTTLGPFTTTDRCADINMRKSTLVDWDVKACVIFIDHTASCNYFTDLSTSWKTIATDVKDNTHFKVMVIIDWPNATGTTAVQLAF